jgi:ADP-ribose pyrophosphatase YjhB (NUDIX family)
MTRMIRRVRRAALVAYRIMPGPLRHLLIRVIAPTFTVGAVVVFRRDDGSLLLVKQRHTGAWALPGGLLQRGEDAAEGAAREVAEEVGIVVDPALLGDPQVVLDPVRRSIDFVFHRAAGAHPGASRNDPVEVTRIGWFPPDRLPTLTEPTTVIARGIRLTTMSG